MINYMVEVPKKCTRCKRKFKSESGIPLEQEHLLQLFVFDIYVCKECLEEIREFVKKKMVFLKRK